MRGGLSGAKAGGTAPKLAAIVNRATKFGVDNSAGTVQDQELNDFDDLRAYVVQLDRKLTKKLEDTLGDIEIRLKGGIEDVYMKVA